MHNRIPRSKKHKKMVLEGRTGIRNGGKLIEAAPPWDCQKVGAVGCTKHNFKSSYQ